MLIYVEADGVRIDAFLIPNDIDASEIQSCVALVLPHEHPPTHMDLFRCELLPDLLVDQKPADIQYVTDDHRIARGSLYDERGLPIGCETK